MTIARKLTVVQLLPALNAGGVERSTLEIGAALVDAGHRSIVVSAGGRLVAGLIAHGSEHVDLDIGRKSLATLRHVVGLRRLFAQLRPDIVHARSRLPAWIGWQALRGMRAARPHFVTTVHGRNSPGRYSAILTRGERVICVSNTLRDYVVTHWPDAARRIEVITRGIDPDQFPRGFTPDAGWRIRFADEFPQLNGGRLLLLPGRGTRLKGHADAVELIATLRARAIDARLLLLGAREPGRETYVAEIEALARERGVAQFLAITPPRADMREMYAAADLVLQLSRQAESFGRTVVEALSIGRPLLGYSHGGVGELLAELYPAGEVALGDAAQLAERAAQLLQAPPAVAALNAYRLADMQARTLRLYEAVAAGDSGASRLQSRPD